MTTDIITLVKQTRSVDAYGDPVITETTRDVFAELVSVSQSEFYQANAQGLKPSLKFRLADYLEYQEEPIVVHKNVRYHVLRTFTQGLTIELTCYREVNPA